jgi:hypothetical protein
VGSDTDEDGTVVLSPDDAFGVLGNETRTGILQSPDRDDL